MIREISRNAINSMYGKVFRAGYCEIQHLTCLRRLRVVACNGGTYGWNWYAYEIVGTDICIVAGYRNLTGERFEFFKNFDDEAEKLQLDCSVTGDEYDKRADELITKLVDALERA